jgi:hypothetical protein
MLILVTVEALVKEITLSLIMRSSIDQLLAYPNNLFMIILPITLGAQIAFIVGVIMELPTPHQVITP